MKREFLDYIEDIVKAMDGAVKFVGDMNYDEFIQDDKTTF